MTEFEVAGALKATGQEVRWKIFAESGQAAEAIARGRGLLVSKVSQTAESLDAELDGQDNGVPAGAPAAAPAMPLHPVPGKLAARTAIIATTQPPEYWGLKAGAAVLTVVAILSYVVAVLLLVAAARAAALPAGFEGAVAALGAALGSLISGALTHAIGAACLALRDIARTNHQINQRLASR